MTEVMCGCGDVYPADSYGAGWLNAVGRCPNCDAGDRTKPIIWVKSAIEARQSAMEKSWVYAHDHSNAAEMVPLYAGVDPADALVKAARLALDALVPLGNAHFPIERELLTDDEVEAACDAITALEDALGKRDGR